MTNFIKMPPIGDGKKEPKKTVFNQSVRDNFTVAPAIDQPNEYKNVMFIRHDVDYGDVFIAWDDNPNDFTILFGEAGDEFNQ